MVVELTVDVSTTGKIVISLDPDDAYMEAPIGTDPEHIKEALTIIDSNGWALIPEDEDPGEQVGEDRHRVYLMEVA